MALDNNNDFFQTTDLILLGTLNAPEGTPFSASRFESVNKIDDPADFYKLSLNTTSSLDVSISGLSSGATVELIRNVNSSRFGDLGETIQQMISNGANVSMRIDGLSKGNYGVRVATTTGTTNYSLNLSTISGAGREQGATDLVQPQFLNVLNGNRVIKGSLNSSFDVQDFYRFRVDTPTKLNAILTSTTSAAATDFALFNIDGTSITNSSSLNATSDSLKADHLPVGQYLIAPRSTSGSTDYSLSITGSPIFDAQLSINIDSIITEDRVFDDFGIFSGSQKADLYTRVTINGSKKDSPTVDNTEILSDFQSTQLVDPNLTKIPIKIEVFDSDNGPDQRLDINPVIGRKDLNLTYDILTGKVTGEGITPQGKGDLISIPGRTILEDSDRAERAGINFQVNYSTFGFREIEFSNSTPITIGSNTSGVTSGRDLGGIVDGRGGKDEVYAKGGDDFAMGGVGNDYVDGGTGDDVVFGGLGKDTCVGGKGRDTIVLAPGTGVDVIQGFRNGTDKLGLTNAVAFEMVDVFQRGQNTVIGLGGERLAVLKGVRANQIGAEDFVAIDFTSFKGMEVPTIVA